jgi:hypothetical protein
VTGRIRRVAFLNVGQGDSALIEADDGWRALFDGGRQHEIEPFEPYLRRLRRVDLMIGTHFDADHLEGLCWLVENRVLAGGIAHAMVPAQPHPHGDVIAAGGGGFGRRAGPSPLLADHFAAGRSLAEAYSALEERASRSERTIAALRRAVDAVPASGGSSADPAAERAVGVALEAGLPALAGLVRTAGQARALRAVDRARRPLLRAAALIERELISASTLKRLIAALDEHSIPWSAAIAPDAVAPMTGVSNDTGPRLWHLAPTRRYVEHYAKHVAAVWDKVFRVMEAVDTGLPTLSNRLSHVMVVEDAAGTAVAICGDSGFQYGRRIPDSLGDGWEEPFGGVTLLHLPHHAGRWGRFGARARAVLGGARRPLAMYGSVGHRRSNPPGRAVVPFLRSVAERRGADAVLYVANRPAGALGRLVSRRAGAAAEGPAVLELRPDGLVWSAEGLDHRGAPSAIEPIGVPLP